MLNLDTHIVLHALAGSLTARETETLSSDSWGISDIVLWEIAMLAELGRIRIDLDDPYLGRALARIQIWPIDLDVCRAMRGLDIASDPADRLVAATSIVHHAPLVTRDRALRRSRIVPLAG